MARKGIRISRRGARTLFHLATRDRHGEIAGKYFHYGRFRKGIYERVGSDVANTEALQERLWKISEDLVGEEFRVGLVPVPSP